MKLETSFRMVATTGLALVVWSFGCDTRTPIGEVPDAGQGDDGTFGDGAGGPGTGGAIGTAGATGGSTGTGGRLASGGGNRGGSGRAGTGGTVGGSGGTLGAGGAPPTGGATGTAVRDRRGGRPTALPRLPDRVAAGIALARVASAMIDVSDGLVQDLGHVARASGVAIRLETARIPVAASCRRRLGAQATAFALAAGEDYELALTVPVRRLAVLDRIARKLGCRLTRIGVVTGGRPAVTVVDSDGAALPLRRAGFDHLAGPARRR